MASPVTAALESSSSPVRAVHKEPSLAEQRLAQLAADISASNRRITDFERAMEAQLLSGPSAAVSATALTKKERVEERFQALWAKIEPKDRNPKKERQVKSEASRQVNAEIQEEDIQRQLAEQAARKEARRQKQDLSSPQGSDSGSSPAGFTFGPSPDASPLRAPSKPVRQSSAGPALEKNKKLAGRAGPPDSPDMAAEANKLSSIRTGLQIALSRGKAKKGTSPLLPPPVPLPALFSSPLVKMGAGQGNIPDSPMLPPPVLQRLDSVDSPGVLRRAASAESATTGSSDASPNQHPPTPPEHALQKVVRVLPPRRLILDDEYGLQPFSAEQILDIRFTQRTVNAFTEHHGVEQSIEDLRDAYLADFSTGVSTVPPIQIVPHVSYLRRKEKNEMIEPGVVELEGHLYAKKNEYSSLDNRRLLAMKMAIDKLSGEEREALRVPVTIRHPFGIIGAGYLTFDSLGDQNPFPPDTYMNLVLDRVHMEANQNSILHTAECYYDRKGRHIDPYYGFALSPVLFHPKA